MATSMLRAPLGTCKATLRGRLITRGARQTSRTVIAQRAVCFKNDTPTATVSVTFNIQRKVPFGQQLVVVGDDQELGGWNLATAPLMSWGEGDNWHCTVELPVGAGIAYKFVQQAPNSPAVWESCLNRTHTIDRAAAELSCVWDAPLATTWPALRGEVAGSAAASEEEEAGAETEDEAPVPAYKSATAFSQFADAVKKGAAAAAEKLQPQDREEDKAAATPAVLAAATAPPPPSPTVAATAAPPSEPKLAAAPVAAVTDAPVAAFNKHAAASSTAAALTLSAATNTTVATSSATPAKPVSTEPTTAPAMPKSGSSFKSFSKAAGTVAMGVAATAMLSALAIDVTDAALLGAVAMGSIAAMSTPSAGGTSGGTNGGTGRKAGSSRTRTAATGGGEPGLSEEGAAAEAAAGDASEAASGQRSSDTIGSKASAPGIILAASVLSAFDAGKRFMADSGEKKEKEKSE